MRDISKRTIQIGIGLGAIVGLIGCGEQSSDVETAGNHEDYALTSANGLASINGLVSANGLTSANGLVSANGLMSANGLASANGLTSINGLASANGLMTTSGGRKTVSYLVRCALQNGDSLVKADQNGVNYTFPGSLGLCPEWKNGDVHGNERCLTAVSACMIAHVNTAGIHVPLWLDNNTSVSFNGSTYTPINWGVDRTNYPMQEGTFFGDIISTGTPAYTGNFTAPAPFFCDGAGYPSGASGIVAGRLGANQSNSPYRNPFGDGVMCQNASATGKYSNGQTGSCPSGSYANPSVGCPDGYDTVTAANYPFKNAITVWRNNNFTPVFDSGYIYRIMPYNAHGGESMDVNNGSTAIGTAVQQWASWDGGPQKFTLVADGGSWRIAMSIDTTKCVDLVGSGSSTGNGTLLAINNCSAGDPSQMFTITPDASTGTFFFKNVQSGRCIDESAGNTSNGVQMQIWDCWSGNSNQKFNIQAY